MKKILNNGIMHIILNLASIFLNAIVYLNVIFIWYELGGRICQKKNWFR